VNHVRLLVEQSVRLTSFALPDRPLRFSEEPASPPLQGQGYKSVAVFTTCLGLNDIILLESLPTFSP